MFKQKIGFDQWSNDTLDEVGVSLDRATEVHAVVESWEKRHMTDKLAYKLLAALYWQYYPEDNDVTRFYQNDIMQRMAFNAKLDVDKTMAIHDSIISLQDSEL